MEKYIKRMNKKGRLEQNEHRKEMKIVLREVWKKN